MLGLRKASGGHCDTGDRNRAGAYESMEQLRTFILICAVKDWLWTSVWRCLAGVCGKAVARGE